MLAFNFLTLLLDSIHILLLINGIQNSINKDTINNNNKIQYIDISKIYIILFSGLYSNYL